jgi:hypothetical protein
MFAKLVRK